MEKLTNFQFYQSANINDCKVIKENFIIRIKEFQLILSDLVNDPMKESVQHYLILGRRGSGKSTLLKRIECEIKTDDFLKEKYEVINFAEEQGSIHRLFDLFEEIIKVLIDSGYEGLPDTETLQIPENYAEYASELFGFIQKSIRGKNKKLVLLIDNIDKVFLNIKEDAQIFREILLNYDDLKIIG
jgi:Cdc6-like AAA superfamily ATPase